MFVTANVSGVQLREASFVEGVRRSLQLSGLAPDRLVLEITESVTVGFAGLLMSIAYSTSPPDPEPRYACLPSG